MEGEPAASSWEVLSILSFGKEGSRGASVLEEHRSFLCVAKQRKEVGNITTSDQNFPTLACKALRTHSESPIMAENIF